MTRNPPLFITTQIGFTMIIYREWMTRSCGIKSSLLMMRWWAAYAEASSQCSPAVPPHFLRIAAYHQSWGCLKRIALVLATVPFSCMTELVLLMSSLISTNYIVTRAVWSILWSMLPSTHRLVGMLTEPLMRQRTGPLRQSIWLMRPWTLAI